MWNVNNIEIIEETFNKNGGVLKTLGLYALRLSSRQIKGLVTDNIITRIQPGFYKLTNYFPREEVIISRPFSKAVIFLESVMRSNMDIQIEYHLPGKLQLIKITI